MASFSSVRYNAVAPVSAPKPCQITSRKAEFTPKNRASVVIWTDHNPRSRCKNKRRSWASDSEDDDDDEEKKEVATTPLEAEDPLALLNIHPIECNSYRRSTAESNHYPTPQAEEQSVRQRRQQIAERRGEGTRKSASAKQEKKELPPFFKVMKRPVVVGSGGSATSLVKQDPMVAQLSRGIHKISETQEPSVALHSPSWLSEINDLNMSDIEKERLRKSKAMEQQQLILQQVAAARRRTNNKSAPKVAIVKREVEASIEASEKQKERLRHQEERHPRTKGVLFMRLSSGKIVRIDRHSEPLAISEELFEEPEDAVADESKEESAPATEIKKPFVPAPIPRVSAWAKVLPVRANKGKDVKEVIHDTGSETEEDHSCDLGQVQKSLDASAPDGKSNEQLLKTGSSRRQKGRRNRKEGSFRSKNKGVHKSQ